MSTDLNNQELRAAAARKVIARLNEEFEAPIPISSAEVVYECTRCDAGVSRFRSMGKSNWYVRIGSLSFHASEEIADELEAFHKRAEAIEKQKRAKAEADFLRSFIGKQ